jgi:hypothetical protein
MLEARSRTASELQEFAESISYKIYDTRGGKVSEFTHNEYIMIPDERKIDEFTGESP